MREDAITPEERKIYTEYSKNLKSKLSKELGVPIKVTASKSVMSNPYIEVRVANYEKDVIPNEFRKKVMDKMGWNPMDPNNINYGNVRSNSIALRYSEWVKVMGESMTKAESFINLCEAEQIVKDMKPVMAMPSSMKKSIGDAIAKVLPTNKYFDRVPLGELLKACSDNGAKPVQEDGTEWSGLLSGANGNATISLAIQKGSEWVISKNMLVLTWYKMDSGKFEVVAYIS